MKFLFEYFRVNFSLSFSTSYKKDWFRVSGVLRKDIPLSIQLNNHTLNNHNHEHNNRRTTQPQRNHPR